MWQRSIFLLFEKIQGNNTYFLFINTPIILTNQEFICRIDRKQTGLNAYISPSVVSYFLSLFSLRIVSTFFQCIPFLLAETSFNKNENSYFRYKEKRSRCRATYSSIHPYKRSDAHCMYKESFAQNKTKQKFRKWKLIWLKF